MRQTLRWTIVPAAVLVLVLLLAMAFRERVPSDDLQRDLALLDAAQLDLVLPAGPDLSIVSAAEKVDIPGPKLTATPTRKRAPKSPPPETVASAAGTDETITAPEVVPVAPSGAPTAVEDPAPESAPAVRPEPIEPRYPVGGGTVYGTGRDRGAGAGGIGGVLIGVVIRGGSTGRDPCRIHDRRGTEEARDRRGAQPTIGILINDRIPAGTTFPRRYGTANLAGDSTARHARRR